MTNAKTLNTPGQKLSNLLGRLPGLQWKLIVPYVALTLVVALGGVFVLTRFVASSFQERFENQLLEASRVAGDIVVTYEEAHLTTLRQMAFTVGVPEALEGEDVNELQDLLFPIILNDQVEALSLVNANGEEVNTWILDPATGQFLVSRGTDLRSVEAIELALTQTNDELGDKFTQIYFSESGVFLLTTAPVLNEAGDLVGVLALGTSLDTISRQIKSNALADVALVDSSGEVRETTLLARENEIENLSLADFEIEQINPAYSKTIEVAEREYIVYYNDLVLRQQDVGILGIALPTNFLVNATSTSRNTLSIIFTLITLAMMVVGYFLAKSIATPILELRDMSLEVAAGDFEQEIEITSRDEIGELAQGFNTMAANLRQRTRELVQSEKLSAVGQLTAGLAHDIKNPLAVIKGLAEILKDIAEDPDQTEMLKSQLDVIRDNADRANNILSDLMQFSRQSDFERKPLDMRDTINDSLRLVEFLAKQAKVEIAADLPDEEVIVDHDLQQLEQVMVNLIQNAIQAIGEHGNINVTLTKSSNDCLISVADDGGGIPAEIVDMVFDPFFTTKDKEEGTGLGLSVVHGIIQSHYGKIWVESETGKGATFFIDLPLSKKQEEN